MGCRLSGPWMSDGTMGVCAQDLRYIRNHETSRILVNYEQPITVQIEGRRGRSLKYHRSSDSSTQTERLWDNVTSDRPCYSHMSLPGNHGDGSRYEYLPNTPRDIEDMRAVPRHDPEFSPKAAQEQNCLLSCCNSNMEEPSSFQSQTEDEDYALEKTVGYLPLHHELDSGLGWTDGSFHQGELSGVETEEGLDECHAHQGVRGARVRGGSPSSESFISSELSDSGFYSVSTAEFLRFQRLLEKRMRVYNSRLHHQGELQSLCMDAQKAHRELEAIPEALATQLDSECAEMETHPRHMVRVASMQLRKSDRPCLNRHSTSSTAIFSTCSSPSGQQRVMTPRGTNAAGMLRRSRTLHHRPVHVEQRRRASHPASPNYCSVTLNRYGHVLQQQLTEETDVLCIPNYHTHMNHPVHRANLTHHANHPPNHANHITHNPNHPSHHANHITHHTNHPPSHANHITHHDNHPPSHANHITHHDNHPPSHANHITHHDNHPPNHANHITHHDNHPPNHANHITHHDNHPPNHANHITHHDNHITHHDNHPPSHANHITHHDNHPPNHANHITHHDNHPPSHANHITQHANHPTHHASYLVHLTNYTTMHANHSAPSMHHANHTTHITNQAAHHAHNFKHPSQHANLPSQPYHATLPTQHTHHTHSTLASHAPHHGHTHATLPAQHTHQAHCTPESHTPHHVHTHTSLNAQHKHHGHNSLPSHATHHDHDHTHITHLAQHTHVHDTLPSHAPPQTHATLPTQHARHMSWIRPKHALSQPSLSSSTDDHHFALQQESHHHDIRGRSFTEPPSEPPTGGKEEREKETTGKQERGRFHTLSHTPSQEGNDTWPKTTNRHGPYSTLEGHVTTTTSSTCKPSSGVINPRAMRNQLLRERALRLADERSGGISTDDETNVEIRRVGRYWSRSERREQVLQKQRQKREALRGGVANNNTSVGGDSSGYSALMELSQRKLSRLRNRKLLDDWTTVEELLTHGTRLGTHDENVQIPNSLLTVTTV